MEYNDVIALDPFNEKDLRLLLTNYILISGIQDIIIDYIIFRIIKCNNEYIFNFPIYGSL